MPESLKVIALISGGKDSLFSILHCLANGHDIVALANLYPEPNRGNETDQEHEIDDIESHMYQTIGHSIIPLYASALNVPIYRRPIRGNAINRTKSYHPKQPRPDEAFQYGVPERISATNDEPVSEDETESLVPLLQHVKSRHPHANALSTGAILSTYQRTRIESVATRLNLIPLAYLWQYPFLPPYMQSSLLHDMRAVGMDARIVKVASGGLDANMLWENVADEAVIRRLGRLMQRYAGGHGVQAGAVLGEGGEFETLAIDGPRVLFARRLAVDEAKRRVVLGEGGTAFVRVSEAAVVAKGGDKRDQEEAGSVDAGDLGQLRRLDLWDDEFTDLLRSFESGDLEGKQSSRIPPPTDAKRAEYPLPPTNRTSNAAHVARTYTVFTLPSAVYVSNITAQTRSGSTVMVGASQAVEVIASVRASLSAQNLTPADISFTTILLRSMKSFASINETYSSLFTLPNPPARVTVAVGDALPNGVDVVMSLIINRRPAEENCEGGYNEQRRALHVQSRSYWAPANIGPYSQAVAIPLSQHETGHGENPVSALQPEGKGGEDNNEARVNIVYVAGQIPLIPASMSVLESAVFLEQAALSLQHLWRVGRAMGVGWWGGGAVAFVPASTTVAVKERALLVGQIWRGMHKRGVDNDGCKGDGGEENDDDEEVDIGNAALYGPWNLNSPGLGAGSASDFDKICRPLLPDWTFVDSKTCQDGVGIGWNSPPCFTVEVAELPRSVQIEWWSFGFAKMDSTSKIELKDAGMTCQVERLQVSWRACTKWEELDEFLDATKTPGPAGVSTDNASFLEVFSSHILNEDWLTNAQAMIIPCKSLWDSTGKELYAAVRSRRYESGT